MKSDIEYAAMVQGGTPLDVYGIQAIKYADESLRSFDPNKSDGDSRRLEIACLNWLMDAPEAIDSDDVMELSGVLYLLRVRPLNNAEYRAAVFALAVAIGKVMEGKDNAE